MILSRSFFPTFSSFSLSSLSRICKTPNEEHHRAVHDARATGKIFLKLLSAIRRVPFGELHEMRRLLGNSVTPMADLLDGFISIGPGSLGPIQIEMLPDNRIGRWDGNAIDEQVDKKTEAESIEEYFEEDGSLSRQIDDFQVRQGQVDMAQEVYNVFRDGGTLLAEAGTGTGKSFAYLLPALLHSREGGGRVVVSTYTRHLQAQLFYKDLPTINEALGGGFRAVLLKGRSNYICHRRFEIVTSDPDNLLLEEKLSLLPLIRWLNITRSGDISEVPGFLHGRNRSAWSRITADSGYCTGRVCKGSGNCFLHRIRSSALYANVLLVNHALLFSDIAAKGGVLGDYDQVVFDEAQHLEKTAAAHLGFEYNDYMLRTVLGLLYDPKTERGLLPRLQTSAFGLLKTPLERGDVETDPLDEAIDAVNETIDSGSTFASQLNDLLHERHSTGQNFYSQKIRYFDGEEEFEAIHEEIYTHSKNLKHLNDKLNKICSELEELELELSSGDDLAGELRRISGTLLEVSEAFNTLTGKGLEDVVFWYELSNNINYPPRLYGAPLNVGEVLNSRFYPGLKSTVFTSATLTVGSDFNYLAGRLGLEDYYSSIYDSPFDMREQVYIGIASFLGNPKFEVEKFTKGIARISSRLSTELDAGTLTLFTSNKMLREAYTLAKTEMENSGWLLLGQGLDGGQANILQRFKAERQSVLYGLDSFWEGIDVPGKALELLIIARLPFEVPTDPLIQARMEKIEREGGNPFMDYTLPEAALKLRQGIGRLIRNIDDSGVVVICDPRIVKSRWGKTMLDSLPVQAIEYRDYNSLFNDFKSFLHGSNN